MEISENKMRELGQAFPEQPASDRKCYLFRKCWLQNALRKATVSSQP